MMRQRLRRWRDSNELKSESPRFEERCAVPSDQSKVASVFDILYADVRRISSLLSQFNDEGILTEITRSAEATTTSSVELSVKIVKGGSGDNAREATSTKVDPGWLIPLLFLDAADDAIRRDIAEASLGSLVMATGKLFVTDLSILQQLWKSPIARRVAMRAMGEQNQQPEETGNRQERRAAAKKKPEANDEHELAMEIIPLLPHSPQINVVSDELAIWGTIDPKYMVGSVSDIMLKHGAKVPGAWNVVGILDALPFKDKGDGEYDDFISFDESLAIGLHGENLWKAAVNIASPARQMLGRPWLSYGITPLMIFREIER